MVHNGWIFSILCEVELNLKLSELNVTAHISAPFHVTAKKCDYNRFFVRDSLQKLGSQLDLQKNYISWQDLNLPMCKMRTHFTIQDSKNVRNAT